MGLVKNKEDVPDSNSIIEVSLQHRSFDPNAWTRRYGDELLDSEEIDDINADLSIVSIGQLITDSSISSTNKNTIENDTNDAIAENGELSVAFIDVGQGDSILIKYSDSEEEHSMLIDAGDNSCGTLIRNYLAKEGVSSIDYVVCTHPDEDHIGGMASVIENIPIVSETMWMPNIEKNTKTYDNLIKEAERNYVKIDMPEVGKEYSLGKASFMFLAPIVEHDKENSNSLVVKLWYNNISYLFTGDCDKEEEEELLNGTYADFLHSTVLKVGHHGSNTSSGDEFIKAVSPEYAIISCGKDNQYGHPHDEVIDVLTENNCIIKRTDKEGTILMVTKGKTTSFYNGN